MRPLTGDALPIKDDIAAAMPWATRRITYMRFWKPATPACAWEGFASKNSALITLRQNPINILTNFLHVDLVFTDDVECFRNNFRCQFIDL